MVTLMFHGFDYEGDFNVHNDLAIDLDHDLEGQKYFFETLPPFLIAKLIKQ